MPEAFPSSGTLSTAGVSGLGSLDEPKLLAGFLMSPWPKSKADEKESKAKSSLDCHSLTVVLGFSVTGEGGGNVGFSVGVCARPEGFTGVAIFLALTSPLKSYFNGVDPDIVELRPKSYQLAHESVKIRVQMEGHHLQKFWVRRDWPVAREELPRLAVQRGA